MLKFVIANRKKETPVVSYFPGTTYHPPAPVMPFTDLHMREITRRENIIAELIRTMPYIKGSVCVAAKAEDEEKLGDILVVDVAKQYADLGKDYKWPQNDNPMLVTGKSLKDESVFFCTINYLKKKHV